MKPIRSFATAVAAVATISGAAQAQPGSSAPQIVTFSVAAINLISVTGSPTLNVQAASVGGAPTSVSDNSTTYSLTTNEPNKKITGILNSPMPDGLTLQVSLAPPGSGTTAGARTLTNGAVDLVTGISPTNASNIQISYTLSATAAAGTVPSTSRTVTFTVVTGP